MRNKLPSDDVPLTQDRGFHVSDAHGLGPQHKRAVFQIVFEVAG